MPSFAPLLLNTYYVSLTQDPVPSACCPMSMGSCYKAVKAATSPGGGGRLSQWVPRLDLLFPISRCRCWLVEWPWGTCLTCLLWSSQARWRELGSPSEKPDVASGPWSPGEGLAPSGKVWHLQAALASTRVNTSVNLTCCVYFCATCAQKHVDKLERVKRSSDNRRAGEPLFKKKDLKYNILHWIICSGACD